MDRSTHDQSLSLADKEARACWLSTVSKSEWDNPEFKKTFVQWIGKWKLASIFSFAQATLKDKLITILGEKIITFDVHHVYEIIKK